MNKIYRIWYLGAGLLLVVAVAVGCSDEPVQDVTCGDGVVLQNGECVPESSEDCADDEVLTPAGDCVDPDEFVCDDGTSYDVGTGSCVSDAEIHCGQGTVEVDGQCVPEDPISCGEDTVLFRGECLLEETICGPDTQFDDEQLHCHSDSSACDGTTEFDVGTGECVDPNVVDCGEDTYEYEQSCLPLESFADVLADDADIDHESGAPIEAVEDEQFVFTGTMDDELSHSFDVDAEQGDWLEVTLYTRGLPSPGLSLEEVDGDWQRSVGAGDAAVPKRTVLVPTDDALELTVGTAIADYDGWDEQGDESWKYVGTVELLDTPAATDWTDPSGSHAGQIDETTDNWLAVDVSETDDLILSVDELGEDAEEPTVELWTEPTLFAERHDLQAGGAEIEFDLTGDDQIYLHIDAVELRGTQFDYQISGSVSETLAHGERISHEISAEAGETLMISHESSDAEPVDVDIRLDGQQVQYLPNTLAANQSDYDEHDSMRSFQYIQQTGSYTVEFVNNSFSDITGFVGEVDVEDVPVFEIGDEPEDYSADIPGSTDPGDWRFVVIDTPDQALVDAVIEASTSTARLTVLEDTTRSQIVNETGSLGTTDAEFETPDSGIYYLIARPWSSFTSLGDLEFDVSAVAVDAFEPGEIYTETVVADGFGVLQGKVEMLSGQVTWRVFNASGDQLAQRTISSTSEVAALIPGGGDYTIQVENETSEEALGLQTQFDTYQTFDGLNADDSVDVTYPRDALQEGERDHLLLHATELISVTADFELADDDEALVRLWDLSNHDLVDEHSIEGESTVVMDAVESTSYAIEVIAENDFAGDYDISIETAELTILTETSNPGVDIDYTAEDSLTFPSCEVIDDIEVFIDIEHWWRGDLEVDIIAPSGDVARVHDGTGGSTSDIVGTYPYPSDTGLEDGTELLDFVGQEGTGTWSIEIVDTWEPSDSNIGTLHTWSVTLDCVE